MCFEILELGQIYRKLGETTEAEKQFVAFRTGIFKRKVNMASLVQLSNAEGERRVALVDGDRLGLLAAPKSAYEIVQQAIASETPVRNFVSRLKVEREISYTDVYDGRSSWALLPPFDHPSEAARCRITGTGLTHLASANTRQSMHAAAADAETDSIRMYRWGVEGGRPPTGAVGSAPEWFYKGDGSILRAHGQELTAPSFAQDAGEEPEVAGIYVIDQHTRPRRVGFAIGNEFSDHKLERRNYLYLAHSKLRECALGPELVLDSAFDSLPGEVRILRRANIVWQKQIRSGQRNMAHSLENIEHHHFKYPLHRRSGDIHVHFFGADAFSFGEGISLEDGDVVEIAFDGLGRPLRNTIRMSGEPETLMTATPA